MQGGWWILNPSPLDVKGCSQNISHPVGSPRTLKTLKVTNNAMMAGIDQHLWFFCVWKVGQDPWTTKASSMTYRFICRGCARPSSGEFARHVFWSPKWESRAQTCATRDTLSWGRCWLLGQDSDDTYTLALQSFFFPSWGGVNLCCSSVEPKD